MSSAKSAHFELAEFLRKRPKGIKLTRLRKNTAIFLQGDRSNGLFLIYKGRVKLTAVSSKGKQAVVAILKDGDFFGEESLSSTDVRITTATTMNECSLVRIQKEALDRLILRDPSFARFLVQCLVLRCIRCQQDLIDRLFNPVEMRLARALLFLAQLGRMGRNETVRLSITQETLAEMIGSNRPRVNEFMNKFKKLGFIDYDNAGVKIHASLLNRVLRE